MHEYTVVPSNGGTESSEVTIGQPIQSSIMGHNTDGISDQRLPINYDRKPDMPASKKSLIG